MSNEETATPVEFIDVQPALLTYAPPIKGSRNPIWILASGFATTAISLAVVYYLDRHHHESVMSSYMYYFVPVGAILVGLASGSGYLVSSQIAGMRVGRPLLSAIFVLQILAYFLAQYVEFKSQHLILRATGAPATFWYHFHLQSTSYVLTGGNGAPTSLGYAGYLFRLLEIASFAAMGVFLPASLRNVAYCQLCQTYMTSRTLALFPASLPYKKFKPGNSDEKTEYQAQQEDLLTAAIQGAQVMADLAKSGETAGIHAAIDAVKPQRRATAKLPARIAMTLTYCRHCHDGSLYLFARIGQRARLLHLVKLKGEVTVNLLGKT